MKLLKILLLTIVTLFTTTGCCWTDHSREIKKIAVPMAKELEHFYKKEKRFPTIKERDKMLERVGCKMDKDVCKYKNKNFILKERTIVNYYDLIVTYENTYCPIYLNYHAKVDNIECLQNPCIDMGQ